VVEPNTPQSRGAAAFCKAEGISHASLAALPPFCAEKLRFSVKSSTLLAQAMPALGGGAASDILEIPLGKAKPFRTGGRQSRSK
jgi:hypothetical protein